MGIPSHEMASGAWAAEEPCGVRSGRSCPSWEVHGSGYALARMVHSRAAGREGRLPRDGELVDQMEVHVGKVENQLEYWRARIAELVGGVEDLESEGETEYRRGIDELWAKHGTAHAKLDQLRSASREVWKAYKADVRNACREIKVCYAKLKGGGERQEAVHEGDGFE